MTFALMGFHLRVGSFDRQSSATRSRRYAGASTMGPRITRISRNYTEIRESRITRISRNIAEVRARPLPLDVRLYQAVELCLRTEMEDQGYLQVRSAEVVERLASA